MTNQMPCSVIAGKDVNLPACLLDQFQFLFPSLLCDGVPLFPSCCVCSSFLFFVTSLAAMAHSSVHARTVPERSRSRDEHMWQRPHTQQRGRSYEPRPEAPPAPRLRKVLVIVDLLGVRPLMTKVHSDVMASTTREITPSLNVMEERALFTYNVLLNTHRLESFTVYNLLYCISQHIWYTWDHYLPPSSMDIRWQDETGDTFACRNELRLVDLLHECRPHWLEGQDCGFFFQTETRPFRSHLEPFIVRMSCHEALPNRNMLP